MARKKKKSTLWDVVLRYLSGLVYVITCLNPLNYLPQSITDALNGQWSEAILGIFQTESSRKRQLLRWVQEKVPDKHARDWTASWSDGTLLCALVEALVPGTCPRYDLLNPSQGLNNARLGLKLAERNLGVAQLVAPEEISDSRLQSSDRLARYVSRLRQASMRIEKTNSQSKRVLSPQVSLEDTVVKDICTVSGSGLTVAEVNREATFNIFARSATIIDFEVQIKVPTGQMTSERVRQRAGLSVETFNQIFLEHRRKQMLQTRTNQKGRAKHRRDQDGDKIYLGFVCTHEGFFQVGYTPKKAGFHLITVLWMGSPVEGCPFRVRVEDPSLEQNKMVLFQDEQGSTTPKTVRRVGSPAAESLEQVQAEVLTEDGRKRLVRQPSGSGSESGAPSEDGYLGGTYRRRIVKQASEGSNSSTQDLNEKSRQGSCNQDQSDSDVSEGAFRRRVIRQDSAASVEISDSETTEARKGSQRAAKMERQNSVSGIVTKRKVLNITVMGEDISDASRRASIFKSSSQGSLLSQPSGDKEEQAAKEAKSGHGKDVSVGGSKQEGCQPHGKTGHPSITVCQPETHSTAIEAMSKKLSSEVLVDSFGELAVKVWSEMKGSESGDVEGGVVKARRGKLTKQSSLVPYLKEEGPGVDPLKETPQNSGTAGSKNTRQTLTHQSSLIPYLKENGEKEEPETSNSLSRDSKPTCVPPRHDEQTTGLPTQRVTNEKIVPQKAVTSSRTRALPRQSSLVPYMKSASDAGLTDSSEHSSALQHPEEIRKGLVSARRIQLQEISKDDIPGKRNVPSTTLTRDGGNNNNEKRSVSSSTRRLVKQSSLIPYMKAASVASVPLEETETISESTFTSGRFIRTEDDIGGGKTPDASSSQANIPLTNVGNKMHHNAEGQQSPDKLLSLQEFLLMEPPDIYNSSSTKGQGALITDPQTGIFPITDDTLLSLNEFLSLNTFEQMQAINLLQKRTYPTYLAREEHKYIEPSVDATSEETLYSLKEFLALRMEESSANALLSEAHSGPKTYEANTSDQTKKTSAVSDTHTDDTLITLKEFLSLRDIAEQHQLTPTSKETTHTQQNSGASTFQEHTEPDKKPGDTGAIQPSQMLVELKAENTDWQDSHNVQNPFVANLLSINKQQGECHNAQDDLLILDMDQLDTVTERHTSSTGDFITEQTSSQRRPVSSHCMWMSSGELEKGGDLTVVHDLVDIGSDERRPPIGDGLVENAGTGEPSKTKILEKNTQSRPGQNRAVLTRQSSLVPYLKQAEQDDTSTPAHREPLSQKDFVCGVIAETEDAERSLAEDRPSVATMVRNWEGATRGTNSRAIGQQGLTAEEDSVGNERNFPAASINAVVGRATLEYPLDAMEAIMSGRDNDNGGTFSIVANVQIEGGQGRHADVLDTMIDQLINHVDGPVTGDGSLMDDSDLENMDMTQDWIIVDTNPSVQPKDIIQAPMDNGVGRRTALRYRNEILVEIGNDYDLENPRTSTISDDELNDKRLHAVGKENVGTMRSNGSESLGSQGRRHRVKSGSERKLSFMADDGENFPSLFVTPIDEQHGGDFHKLSEQAPTPLFDGRIGLANNQTDACRTSAIPNSSSSLLEVLPNTGIGSFTESDKVSCQWNVPSGQPAIRSSAIKFNPAGNSAIFLPSQAERLQSISPYYQERVVRPGVTYRSSVTLQVNQDPPNSPHQPDIRVVQAETNRDGTRRRQIRDSFRKAVVDKVDESLDGPVSDCIERDAMDSEAVGSFYPRAATRVDCSHKSLQVHSHQIRKETGYHGGVREQRSRQGAAGGVTSIRNLLRSVDEKVSELSDIASEVMQNSSQHRNSLAEALRAAARKTSGEAGPFDDDTTRRTTRQSTDDSGISDVTIYVDGKGPYTWLERHQIPSLEERIPYWLLNDSEPGSDVSSGGLHIPHETERAWKSDSECMLLHPDRTNMPKIGPQERRRSSASLPDTDSMNDFTAQLASSGTFANMRTAGRRLLPGEPASLQACRQSWAGFPHTGPRRAVFTPRTDGYEAGDEPNEDDESDVGTRKTDGRSRSRALAARILAFGPGLDHGFVGAKNNFQVSTRNAGNGAINVSLVGPRKNTVAEVNVIYTGDDLYEVIYDVTQPGYYVLSVKWMDRNIPDSPFIVKVSY